MIQRLLLSALCLMLGCIAPSTLRGQVTLSTFAGGAVGYSDGKGIAAAMNHPNDVSAGRDGSLYVADTGNHVIRKITANGSVSTIAGTALESGAVDGMGAAARFKSPYGIAADAEGAVFVSDSGNHCIRKIDTRGEVTLYAGAFSSAGYRDGSAADGRFDTPYGVAVDAKGILYVADSGNQTIRAVDQTGKVATVAGNAGASGFVDGPAQSARFNTPTGVAVDGDGNLFVSDFGNAAVRKIGTDGSVTTLWNASSHSVGAISPAGIACDSYGNLFIADTTTSNIVRIGKDGAVTLLAGKNGTSGSTPDHFELKNPGGVALSSNGTLYIADTGNASIRKGVITSFFNNTLAARTPTRSTVIEGGDVSFGADSLGEGFEYTWAKNGLPLVAGNHWLDVKKVTANDSGVYDLTVTDAFGTKQSLRFTLEVVPTITVASNTKLINLSTRAYVGMQGNVAIAGFAIRGTVPKHVLIRAVGPTLKERFQVNDALLSPVISVYREQLSLASNQGWNDDTQISEAATRTGAFAFSTGSRDAALLLTLPAGNYTAIMSGADGAAGTALLEVYDADQDSTGSEMVNLSSRSLVGGTAGTVIAGFVITGNQAKQVLVRASGAALHDLLGMDGTLASPRLQLFSGREPISDTTTWDAGTDRNAIAEAFSKAGAFSYLPGSKDAALLVTLQPGNYTAQVTGVGDSQGVSLVEIYDVK